MQKNFFDFLYGEPVIKGAFHMKLNLRRPIQCGEHREIQHTAGLAGKPWPRPRIAPAHLCGDILKGHHESIGLIERAINILRAKDFAANLHSLFKQLRG